MEFLVPPLIARLVTPIHASTGTGGAPPPPSFTPSLDFSDDRNSQYVALLFEDF
jgi:hypothetical protein